jgi:hypothetical protein
MTIAVTGVKAIYDLSLGWTCPECNKVNDVKQEVWREK